MCVCVCVCVSVCTYVPVHGAGQVDPGALPPGQRDPALAHQRQVPVRELLEVRLQAARIAHL